MIEKQGPDPHEIMCTLHRIIAPNKKEVIRTILTEFRQGRKFRPVMYHSKFRRVCEKVLKLIRDGVRYRNDRI